MRMLTVSRGLALAVCGGLLLTFPAHADEQTELRGSNSWAPEVERVEPLSPAPAGSPAGDIDQMSSQNVVTTPKSLAELRDQLTADDPVAVLEAVRYALDEVSDGASYVWHRRQGPLWGIVRPVASHRNQQGQVCRRVVLAISLDEFTRQTEALACRMPDKRWQIEG
jgi:surface antigen